MATGFKVGDGSFSIYNDAGFEMQIINDTVQSLDRGYYVGATQFPENAVELVKLMAEFLGYRLEPEVKF